VKFCAFGSLNPRENHLVYGQGLKLCRLLMAA